MRRVPKQSLPLVCCWHRSQMGSRVRVLPLNLEPNKEEQLIAVLVEIRKRQRYRASDLTARILVADIRLRSQHSGIGSIIGRKGFRAPIIVNLTVITLAATLGASANLNAAIAIFCGIVAGLNRYFLDHVDVRRNDRPIIRADVDQPRAIDADIVIDATDAVHRITCIRVTATPEGVEIEGARARIRTNNPGKNTQKLEAATSNDRQRVELFCSNRVRSLTGFSLNLLLLGNDRDGFRRGAYLKCHVMRPSFLGHYIQRLYLTGLEA